MRGSPTFLKSSVITLSLGRPGKLEIILGIAVSKLKNLNAMKVIRPQGVGSQVVPFKIQRQSGYSYSDGQQNLSHNQNSTTCRLTALASWLWYF